jgi:hypothetical protein
MAVGLFILLYFVARHSYPGDSDGATVVLEGQAMAHGHPALSGWALSLDSFWLVDALWYLGGAAAYGLHPALIYAVPAAIAAAVVVAGVVLACDERSGKSALAAGAAVIAILAFPSHALAYFFLRGPLHVGTALWCLVAFYALRKGRFGWGVVVAAVFLAAGMLGDLQAAALGVVPVVLAGLAAMARRRQLAAGAPLVAAGLSAVALAAAVREIAHAVGTYSIGSANEISKPHQMLLNVRHGLHEGVVMMGVGHAYYGLGGEPTALSYTHVVALLVALAALAGSLAALVFGVFAGRPSVVGTASDRAFLLDDMLVFATFASPAAFVVLAFIPDPEFGRYLTAGIIFGAVLSGRVVGRVVADFPWPAMLRVAAVLGVALIGCYAAGVGYEIGQAAPVTTATDLSRWLEARHLTNGIGAYWSASIVTVVSSGDVTVRPVVSSPAGRLMRYQRNSASYWYGRPFGFLVFSLPAVWGGVDEKTAVATFGNPARTYRVDGFEVMVWKKSLRVSSQG